MQYNDVIMENIIFRKPVAFVEGWFSNIWYKTGRCSEKLIIKTPRLRIVYSAKKFETSYCYCVSLANCDIDDDISDFFKFINNCDQAAIRAFKKYKEDWNIGMSKITYKSALTRKSAEHDYYFKIKLLQEKESVITTINSCDRKQLTADDIVYSQYADQFIEFAGIIFRKEGVAIPVWYAHQIVISPYKRLFLAKSLLDDITPQAEAEAETPTLTPHPYIPQLLHKDKGLAPKPIFGISSDILLNMKSKLKTIQHTPVPEIDPYDQIVL